MEMEMSREGIFSLLQQCKEVGGGRHVHALMLASGFHAVPVLADHLIRILASCHSLLEANLAFCSIAQPSVFTWHSIIAAHSALGLSDTAIDLYFKMQAEGTQPDKFIYTCILKACADTGALRLGIHIHNSIIRDNVECNVVVGSALVHMYFKCGASEDAHKIFHKLLNRNAISWNTLIAQCNQYDGGDSALELLSKMQQQGIRPEKSTFSSILKACASAGALDEGKRIHEQVIKSGLDLDVVVGSTVVDMYSKCGDLKLAREAFDKMPDHDIVSWGAMISGYVEHGDYHAALELFAKLLHDNISPNKVVLACVLKACASIGAIVQARWIHNYIIRSDTEIDKMVGSTLVDMYARCGSLNEASKVFALMSERDVVSWNAIIGGYTQHDNGSNALMLYFKMQRGHVKPDRITYLGVLKACGILGASWQGKVIHNHILRDGFDSDVTVGSALVDMYAKCGSLQEAHTVFNKLPDHNVVSWGALISGCAQLGYHNMVGQCLENMTQQGVSPSTIIYINILASCSHVGQVEDSRKYFKSMVISHGVTPNPEHFNCMIDALGRAGCLYEAIKLLRSMPMQADITCWMSLLASCRTYGDVDLGRQCFDELVRMDPDYASAYILMFKIYTDMNMWEHANKIRQMRKGSSAWKKPALACIDVKHRVQEFKVGNTDGGRKFLTKLSTLKKAMRGLGYLPQIGSVDADYEEDGYLSD